ncbi:hypothetical protein SAMN02927937_01333 [Paenimyroides aquimaris]|uniref:SH3 domain-containing protein n=1 Tax=Paenimyroides marinum TaxID=1159016 RepID=A0A1H6KYC6_9FLAO|nr:SH3 domain-containing protein [Paenimyroides aquimaris]SEH77021.1 hypothetical protein SAMN02927937_01333 [Paenimyroides aquimaris]
MKKYLFFLLWIFQMTLYAQKQDEAIILEDKEIVYSKPSIKSKIEFTLHKNEVFLIIEDNSDWVEIEINSDKLSKNHNNITGFISKSKIHLVDNLQIDSSEDVSLSFRIVKVDLSRGNIGNKKYGIKILDSSFSIEKMFLKWKDKLIEQDQKFFNDIYNISFEEGNYPNAINDKFSIYKSDDVYFIKQKCGDGAGFYEITWVVKDGKIIQRVIDEI